MEPIQISLSITVDGASTNSLFELLSRAIDQGTIQCRQTTVTESQQTVQAKPVPTPAMTPLEASRHAHFGVQEPPNDQGLLIDGKEVARLLDVSPRTIWRLKDSGKMPRPIRLGNLVRWSYDEIKEWIELGCPSQKRGRGR